MSENAIQGIMDTTMDKIRTMVDADTIIGDPITLPNDITLIPVSKISYGFASGGSDLPSKKERTLFGGGAGAGITITPTAFICVNGTDVKLMHISKNPDAAEKAVGLVPELFDKITALFRKDKPASDSEE